MKRVLLIILILVLIVCLCSISFGGCNRRTNKSNTLQQEEMSGTKDESGSSKKDGNEPQTKETVTVRFLNTDYSAISTQKIAIGGNATCPSIDFAPAHSFFSKWDKDLSAIESDINIFPIYTNVAQENNAIGYNSVYTSISQNFSIDIEIQGIVNYAGMDLIIEYGSGIQIESIIPCKGYAEYLHNSLEKEIAYSFASASVINGAMTLLSLYGTCISTKAQELTLAVQVTSISTLNENGDIQDAPYVVNNGTIYVI